LQGARAQHEQQTSSMPVTLKTILLLSASNVFMTFAWYAHLKNLNHKPWFMCFIFRS
jgi:uncharacterized protein (DUF486 family)